LRKKFTAAVSALLSAGALAVGLSTVMAGSAQASVTPDPTWNEIWAPYLTAQSNTMCVDVPGSTNSPGAHLQLFHCHGYGSDGVPQRWHFRFSGSGPAFYIQNENSGLCITATTTGITQDFCGSRSEWTLRSENLWSTDPNFSLALTTSLQDDGTALCLAAGNSTDSNHTPLVTAPCNTGTGGFQNGLAVFRLG
jgi:hypothetical protein